MLTKDANALAETIYRLDGPLRWGLSEPYELIQLLRLPANAHILDVGAGTGYLTLPLASAVTSGGMVTALDASSELLKVLRSKVARRQLSGRIRTQQGTATELPFADASFDVVSCAYLLHELGEDVKPALAEMGRVLKPLGQLIIADYRRIPDRRRQKEIERWYQAQPDGGGANERHLRFSLSDVERLLHKAGFEVVKLSTWANFHMHIFARKQQRG